MATALWLLAVAGPAVAAGGASVTTVPGAPLSGGLVPGPDGLLWHAGETDDSYGSRIVRISADGVTATTVPGYSPSRGAEPKMLPDGSMGLVVDRLDETGGGIGVAGLALARLVPGSGALAAIMRLPPRVDDATALAVAPDGAVWFAKSCEDRLGRISPSRSVQYVRLSATRCQRDLTDLEQGAALAFDPKGALWFADFCTGRVARVSLGGRVREWRAPRAGCASGESITSAVAVDPRGGIAFAARGSGGDVSGRIHGGRLEYFSSYGTGVFTPDGALWRVVSGEIERHDPNGSTTTVVHETHLVRWVSDLVPARNGGVAVVRATYWQSDPNYDSHNTFPRPEAYLDGHVVIVRRDRSETSWPLPDGGTDVSSQLSRAYLALGSDGAFYVRENRVAQPDFSSSSRLLRVLPDELAPPRPATVRVSAVLGRVGRVLWVQVSCDAEIARFCLGTLRLTGGDVSRAPAQFALVGQSRGAVPVPLGARALRLLRHGGKLRTVAVVRTDDGTVTRSSVTIGSNAPR
ncbi:MAG TPA: hypothetical protein VKB03_08570 [Conexibacter sp.]|nr:hypothetical protein [Conexibacter sp.]